VHLIGQCTCKSFLQVEAFRQIKIFKCIQWPIDDESSYFKLEHLDKWSTLNAFNSPIDECTFSWCFQVVEVL
jgi:hypothetical protein